MITKEFVIIAAVIGLPMAAFYLIAYALDEAAKVADSRRGRT